VTEYTVTGRHKEAVNLLKLIRYKRKINRTMNGEFREDIEVILYKRKTYKIDKLITIEEFQIIYQITKV
jgi:hypothetical protein